MEKFFSIVENMNLIGLLKFYDFPKDLWTLLSTLEMKKNVVLIIF